VKRKAFEAQRQRIQRLEEKWAPPMGLRWWTITHVCYAKRKRYAKETGCDIRTAAACAADWRYCSATISFNLPIWATLSDDKAEAYFVHELVHIFLEELESPRADHDDHEERVCTRLAKAFLWVRGEG